MNLKNIKTGLIVMTAFNLFFAQIFSNDNYYKAHAAEGGISAIGCLTQGNVDFDLFLDSIISFEGLIEGLFEPFNDILFRNTCQSTDIAGLIKQQDKIRTQIRQAFLTCNNEKLPALRVAYDKLSIEIFYVRRVVKGSITSALPYDILNDAIQASGINESLYTPQDKLYSDITKRYSNNSSLNDSDLNMHYTYLDFKYRDRKAQYVVCKNNSWGLVVEKLEEFIDTVGGIAPAITTAQKNIGGAAEKMVESITDGGIEAWFEGRLAANLNNLSLEDGLGEIGENISNYVPNFDISGGVSQNEVLNTLEAIGSEIDAEKLRVEMSTYYELMYKETSDASVEIIVNDLDNFNEILKDSFDPLSVLLEGTKMMNNRQCPNK